MSSGHQDRDAWVAVELDEALHFPEQEAAPRAPVPPTMPSAAQANSRLDETRLAQWNLAGGGSNLGSSGARSRSSQATRTQPHTCRQPVPLCMPSQGARELHRDSACLEGPPKSRSFCEKFSKENERSTEEGTFISKPFCKANAKPMLDPSRVV